MAFMQEFFKRVENLHHAYIIEGDRARVIPELISFLEKEHSVSIRGNSDFWHNDFDSFLLEDAQELRRSQARKGIDGGKKFFIFSAIIITEDAQNALLKIFEEPTAGTHFFVIVPSLSRIFSTLLSRAVIIQTNQTEKSYDISCEKKAQDFLKSLPAKRITLIKDLIEEKNKEQAILFLNALEKNLAEHFNAKNADIKTVAQLRKTARARADLMTNVPSIKLIFEHLALTL